MIRRRSDEQTQQQVLRTKLAQCIMGRSSGGIRDLQVDVSSGRVVLQGRAKTYYAKQLAQEAARQVHKLAELVNEIVVDSSSVTGSAHPKQALEAS